MEAEQVNYDMECPVCYDTFEAPLYGCIYGHTICASCKEYIRVCPVCRSTMAGRNTAFENLIKHVLVRCKHEGCDCVVNWERYSDHVNDCGFREVPCPSCFMKISLNDMNGHVVDKHRSHILQLRDNNTVRFFTPELTNQIGCVWFIQRHSTKCFIPYILHLDVDFNAQKLTLFFGVIGEGKSCTLVIELKSCTYNWQKVTFFNKSDRIPLGKPGDWKQMPCFQMNPSTIDVSARDKMFIKISVSEGELKQREEIECENNLHGCKMILPILNIEIHPEICARQKLSSCIVKKCKKIRYWESYMTWKTCCEKK